MNTPIKRLSINTFFFGCTEFHGLDKDVLIQALRTLEAERKAELMEFDGSEGVKFF